MKSVRGESLASARRRCYHGNAMQGACLTCDIDANAVLYGEELNTICRTSTISFFRFFF